MKTGAESIVGMASLTSEQFLTLVRNTLFLRKANIERLEAIEPCENCTADCTQFYGPFNCYNANTQHWTLDQCPVPEPAPVLDQSPIQVVNPRRVR
jgi:hypothetical protein